MFIHMHWRSRLAVMSAIAALVGIGACSSNDNTGGGTGSIKLTLSPPAATVQAGSSTIVTGYLTRSSYTGSVQVTASTSAAGITGTVVTQPNTSDTAMVNLAVASTAVAGTDTITVIASGNGVSQSTATFVLTVVAASNQTVNIGLTPAAATLQAGSSTTLTGLLTRGGGYNGNVTVTDTTTASGVTATVNTQPNAGDTAQIVLAASSTATPGIDTVTFSAAGSGVTTATQTFIVTVVAANGQSFTFGAGTSTIALSGGTTASDTLRLTRTGFTGNVTFSAENLPAGVTATFTQPTTSSTGVVTLMATSGVTAGNYTILLRGTGAGVSDVTVPVTLAINGTGTGGSFTLSASANALTIAPGHTDSTMVNVTRGTGYTGAVTLSDTVTTSLGGSVAGFTTTLAPNPVGSSATSAMLVVTPGSSVPTGIYTVTVHATGAGITGGDQTLPIEIVVSALTGSAVNLDYSSCSAASKPIYVAYQDGAGAWTHVTGNGDMYSFNISANTGALAVVTQSAGMSHTSVQYLTKAELTASASGCAAASGNAVTGTYAGTQLADQVHVALGNASTLSVATGTTGSYMLNNVAGGTQDLVAYDRSNTAPGSGDKIIVRRDVAVTNGAVMPVLDFSSAEAETPAQATITVSGASPSDSLTEVVSYLTGTSCSVAPIGGGMITSGQTTFVAYGLADTAQRATDLSQVTVLDVSGNSTRGSTLDFHALIGTTVTLPTALTGASVTALSGGPYKRLQAIITLPVDYSASALSYSDASGNTLTVYASPAYLGGQTATLTAPDLSGASGFNVAWEPATSASVNYTLTATSNAGAACADGANFKFATVTGAA